MWEEENGQTLLKTAVCYDQPLPHLNTTHQVNVEALISVTPNHTLLHVCWHLLKLSIYFVFFITIICLPGCKRFWLSLPHYLVDTELYTESAVL